MKTWHECMTGKGLDNYSNYGGSTEHKDMLVLLGRNRDSAVLTNCNFDIALEMLGGESGAVQVHRFNHWAVGWVELILIDSTDKEKVKIAEDIECSLADYPVLDDSAFSEAEHDDYIQSIGNWAFSDACRMLGFEDSSSLKESNAKRIHNACLESFYHYGEAYLDEKIIKKHVKESKVIVPFSYHQWQKSKGQGYFDYYGLD